MNLTFKLCTDSGCDLTITDYSRDQQDYMPDEAKSAIVYLQNNRWKYRDTATIDILEYNPINTPETPEITNTSVSYHVIEDMLMDIDENHLKIKKDGHYTVHHIVLPTKEGIARMIEDEEISSEGDIRDIVGTLYYVDGCSIYKQTVALVEETYPVEVTKQKEVPIEGTSNSNDSQDKAINETTEDSLEENTEGTNKEDIEETPKTKWVSYTEIEYHTRTVEQITSEEVDVLELTTRNCAGTSISHETTCFFSICKLWDCYINLCKEIFNNTNYTCKISQVNTYARDFVWMTINIIKYHIEKGNLIEAQRLLESVNGCGGFCQNTNNPLKSTGCGCGR